MINELCLPQQGLFCNSADTHSPWGFSHSAGSSLTWETCPGGASALAASEPKSSCRLSSLGTRKTRVQAQVFLKVQVLHTESCFDEAFAWLHLLINHHHKAIAAFSAVLSRRCLLTPHKVSETLLFPTQEMGSHAETIAWEELNVLPQRIKTRWSIVQIRKFYKGVNFLWENKALSLTVSMNICNHGHQYCHKVTINLY